MLKEEFENIICREIDSEQYDIIDKVYTWHPIFEMETAPKTKCASLYEQFGIGIFLDMERVADEMIRHKDAQTKIRQKIEARKMEIEELKREFDDIETQIAQIKEDYR